MTGVQTCALPIWPIRFWPCCPPSCDSMGGPHGAAVCPPPVQCRVDWYCVGAALFLGGMRAVGGDGTAMYTTLGGSRTWVHASSVGKYGSLLSSSRSSISLHLRWNMGQLLAQLACPALPHEMQWGRAVLVHVSVLCLCAHVPQVSTDAEQLSRIRFKRGNSPS